MAWYKTGTVAVAATKVTGTGTNFLDAKFGIGPGQAFLLPASGTVKIYEIASVEDATHLTLTTTAGTVAAGAAYAVMSFYTDSVPDFSKRLAAQLGYYQSQMDGWQTIMTGTGAVSVTAPDGTVVNISSFAKLTSDMAKAYSDGGLLNATVTPNSLGNAADFNVYYQTANAQAIIENGYPVAKAGTLYVTKSAYGCQQKYITFEGEEWNRGLSGAFTPAAPNWKPWVPQYGGVGPIVPLNRGGTGSDKPFGTSANTFAQGNDARLNSVNGKTGGSIAGQVVINGSDVHVAGPTQANNQGTHMGWNNLGISGGSDFICNRGLGDGGFRHRIVNQANTAVITDFTMLNTGQGVSSAGWVAASDERVKNNLKEIDPEIALEAVCSWRDVTWQYADTPAEFDEDGKLLSVVKGAMGVGNIAQDVFKDCPEAITILSEGALYASPEGEIYSPENQMSLNTTGVAAGFHGASIKALKKRIETQAEVITTLTDRLSRIESALKLAGPAEQTS